MTGARLPVYREFKVVVKLTQREEEFINLRIGEELSYKEIAERQKLALNTVKHIFAHIGFKLGLHGEFGNSPNFTIILAKWAIRNKIVEL